MSLSTVTRWSFDNDQRHVTAFRPISKTAHSWSDDNTRSVCDVLSYYWTLSILSLTIANDRQWPLVLILGQFPVFVSVSVYATEREEHDTLQRHQRTIKLQPVYVSCGSWDVWHTDRQTYTSQYLAPHSGWSNYFRVCNQGHAASARWFSTWLFLSRVKPMPLTCNYLLWEWWTSTSWTSVTSVAYF